MSRKAYHCTMGLICFALYAFVLNRTEALALLVGVGGLFVVLDICRLYIPALNALALQWFGSIMRREEVNGLSGNSYFVLGLIPIVVFFPKWIVLLSVLYLAVGDPVAAVIGTQYGKVKLPTGKSLEGSLANGIVTSALTLVFALSYLHFPLGASFVLAAVGGAISMIAEGAPLRLNDNLTIPIFSAVLLYLVAPLLGLPFPHLP